MFGKIKVCCLIESHNCNFRINVSHLTMYNQDYYYLFAVFFQCNAVSFLCFGFYYSRRIQDLKKRGLYLAKWDYCHYLYFFLKKKILTFSSLKSNHLI